MVPVLSETVFVPPHQPLRLAQTRFRLLPGLAVLGVFVLLGLALGPYANVAAVPSMRGARYVERAIRGAVAVANPMPTGATVFAQATTPPHAPVSADADRSVRSRASLPRPRHASSPASPAKHSTHKGPLPPTSPGAHGDAGSASGHAKANQPGVHGNLAQGDPGNTTQQSAREHGKDAGTNGDDSEQWR